MRGGHGQEVGGYLSLGSTTLAADTGAVRKQFRIMAQKFSDNFEVSIKS